MTYMQPKTVSQWTNDISNGELYSLSIMDDDTVVAACGRFAYSSGCKIVSWSEFLQGDMHQLVEKTMGNNILQEALDCLSDFE
ncbi:MAG: hypothetical protein MJK04_01335 [Psychrosphaera sp.]|nr:hypothetical protein [Psychrosphaera sp.]